MQLQILPKSNISHMFRKMFLSIRIIQFLYNEDGDVKI